MTTATKPKSRPIVFSAEMVRAILEGRKTMHRVPMHPQPDEMDEPEATWMGAHNGGPEWCWWTSDGYRGPGCGRCPFGRPGDTLWVRETFGYWQDDRDPHKLLPGESFDPAKPNGFALWTGRAMRCGECYLVYRADGYKRPLAEWQYPHDVYEHCVGRFDRRIPSIQMPRWASRITLRVKRVWVEPLQEISEGDCEDEGVTWVRDGIWGLRSWEGGCFKTAEQAYAHLWDTTNAKRGYGWNTNPWVWCSEFERVEG